MRNPNQQTEVNHEPSGAYFFAQIRQQSNYQLGLLLGRIEPDKELAELQRLHDEAEKRKTLLIHAGHIAIAS